MDCKRVKECRFLFLDNELEDDLLAPFREHLRECGICERQVSYTKKFLLVVRSRCTRYSAPDGLRRRILTRLPHRVPAPPD